MRWPRPCASCAHPNGARAPLQAIAGVLLFMTLDMRRRHRLDTVHEAMRTAAARPAKTHAIARLALWQLPLLTPGANHAKQALSLTQQQQDLRAACQHEAGGNGA